MIRLGVQGLSAGYGGIVALRDVSLEVPAGGMVCLIGANGAGKTTLLKTISGLVPARQGSVSLDGTDITRLPAHDIARRGVLHVPEGRQVFGPLSVEENLRLGALASSTRKGDFATDIERVYTLFPILRERRAQAAAELSGGQQQMLAIGRALMGRPVVLLLDEPSLGLAPVAVAQIYAALQELNRAALAILVVEQNARRAMEVTDYTYVIEQGAIVLEGPSGSLRDNEMVVSHFLGGVEMAGT
jgi:branched-chain amino acid transport system ATP-binding protein